MKEPKGLSPDDQKRPDGLTLVPWSHGKSLVWDFTCCDTLCQSHIPQTKNGAGKAAEKAESGRLTRYADIAAAGFTVMPVASETLGSWAPMGLKFLKELGSTKLGDQFQSLSIAIQRGNSASIAGTLPSTKQLDEIYYL